MKEKFDKKLIVINGVVHGDRPSNDKGHTIAILDFCFPFEDILNMAKIAKKIYILDHHISTQRDLDKGKLPDNVVVILDNSRSGAEITWDWVYPGVPRPWFVEAIGDRDLFRWTNPYSKYVTNALYHDKYYRWERLEELFNRSTDTETINKLIDGFIKIGKAMDPTKEIEKACSGAYLAKMTTPDGTVYKVKLVRSPEVYKSDVGHQLSKSGCDFSALYAYDFMLNQWWISLRASDESTIDVSQIAQQFGRGGGHPKSAGFTIFGSNGDNMHNYFEIITVPPSRKSDLDALKELTENDKIIIKNVS